MSKRHLKVLAAIDLLDGRAVQLVQGDPRAMAFAENDPVRMAREWIEAGCPGLHVVDLGGALGRDRNRELAGRLLDASDVPVQIGGGVRVAADLERWLDAGAERVIVGTRAVTDPAWLARTAERFPDQLVVAADVRDGHVLVRGWQEESDLAIDTLLERLSPLPLAAVLVTDVNREGQLRGADIELFERAVGMSEHPLVAAGSITTLDDLRALETIGVDSAVLGMSLATGTITPEALQQEFWK
jgi:phosphoribosylformimino-5-aminoimidazole carboxamide ribotide isomerase